MAVSSSLDSSIRIWDMESGKQRKLIDAGPGALNAPFESNLTHLLHSTMSCFAVDAWTVAFSPDSRLVASGSHTGKVNLFGVESGSTETTLDTRGKFVLSIAYVSRL